MPWCEECSKYLAPSAMNPDGTCPKCNRQVEAPVPPGSDSDAAAAEKAPWHFKMMVVALIVYLVWRFADMFV